MLRGFVLAQIIAAPTLTPLVGGGVVVVSDAVHRSPASVAGPVEGVGRVDAGRSAWTVARRESWAMGTRVLLSVGAPEEGQAAAIAEGMLREIERTERRLSSWDPTTPLSAINRAPAGEAVPVPAELLELLAEVDVWAERTGRAFEPVVGALVDVWGLRTGGRAPTATELATARAALGPSAVRWNLASGVAVRARDDAWIDAGGFGKGAALRSVAHSVAPDDGRDDGPVEVVADLGGQLWVSAGRRRPWMVEVADPADRDRSVARLALDGVSVATSGHGERPGHILDPRTGLPTPAWGSVTVVHPDPLAADILATALHVMGPAQGVTWAREHGVAALFAVLEPSMDAEASPPGSRGAGVRITVSPALAPYLDDRSEAALGPPHS